MGPWLKGGRAGGLLVPLSLLNVGLQRSGSLIQARLLPWPHLKVGGRPDRPFLGSPLCLSDMGAMDRGEREGGFREIPWSVEKKHRGRKDDCMRCLFPE